MSHALEDISWKVHVPFGERCHHEHSCPRTDLLEELSAFRGRIWYDNGSRPHFKHRDGQMRDDDAWDAEAYHILARSRGLLVGCVRMLPLSDSIQGTTASLLGAETYHSLLNRIGTPLETVMEGGRLAVDPAYRGRLLGFRLTAGGWALARHLGYKFLLCPSGTRDRQDRLFVRFGFNYAPGVGPILSSTFADYVRIMFADLSAPSPECNRFVAGISSEFPLRRLAHVS